MASTDRQEQILDYLRIHQSARVSTLTALLYASEATVRRDLNHLSRKGLCRRVHGGATLITKGSGQIPLAVRESENRAAKEAICAQAASLLHDGYVIFIDASSTAQYMVSHLCRFRDLTVITNGLRLSEQLSEHGIRTWCTGGELIANSYSFVGHAAERFLEDFRVDACFLSCKGLNDQGELTDTSEAETALRRCVLAISAMRIALVTSNKMGKTYMHRLCNACDLDHILSDAPLPLAIRLRGEK